MSPFVVAAKVLGLVPLVIDAITGIAKAVRGQPADTRTWTRDHFWTVVDYNALDYTYACQWCGTPRNTAAMYSRCPGPPKGKR